MMKKIILYFITVLISVTLLVSLIFQQEIRQLYQTIRLFEEDRIVHNFSHMADIFPTIEVERSGPVYSFQNDPKALPDSFWYNGRNHSIQNWIDETRTTALLVVRDSSITYESYFLNTNEMDKRISWSMSKSFLSALFGIAVSEGFIPDLNVAATEFVPELKGTGYDGITIKNLLQMSSGIYFNEDYGDFNSDINRFGRAIALGDSFDEFAASLQTDPERKQGTYLHYVSIDTHVLGMVLRAATGKPLKEFFEKKIWSKAGFEYNAHFIADGTGEPMVLGGLNMTTRDYARFATLIRDEGKRFGSEIIPYDWLVDSLTPDAPHLLPGKRDNATTPFGYGYQWWIPERDEGEPVDFMGIGIYGQYMYINPELDIVILKNSADLDFEANNFESDTIATYAFRAIAESL